MKIAYVTTYDSSNIQAWSGLGNNILRALQESGFQSEVIDNLTVNFSIRIFIKRAIYKLFSSKSYIIEREPILLKNYASQIEDALASLDHDIVFSPGVIPIAFLHTEKPIVFWADATFAGMVDFYPTFSNLCSETIKNGNKIEQMALSKSRIAIFSSEWAANTAIQNYDVDPTKVKVVPFGANIISNRNLQDVNSIFKNKSFDTCQLLFVGVNWFRKGGDIAVKVAELLTQRGIKTELHIVGCNPEGSLPAFVKVHGFISKASQEGRNYLDKLMSESHFLIVPSRAEAYGLVFAEAGSFGLPSLATKVGGIPTIIRDGKNGQTFPLDVNPEKYCDYIERYIASREAYKELALSSFGEYNERLNWSSSGKKVYELIKECC